MMNYNLIVVEEAKVNHQVKKATQEVLTKINVNHQVKKVKQVK